MRGQWFGSCVRGVVGVMGKTVPTADVVQAVADALGVSAHKVMVLNYYQDDSGCRVMVTVQREYVPDAPTHLIGGGMTMRRVEQHESKTYEVLFPKEGEHGS